MRLDLHTGCQPPTSVRLASQKRALFVNRLEEDARIGKAGTLAAQLSRLKIVVLDELG